MDQTVQVIDVTEFLKTHPGGEAAIMAFAGKDASVEWNMIHKPEFLDIYVKDKILGDFQDGRRGRRRRLMAGDGGGGQVEIERAQVAAQQSLAIVQWKMEALAVPLEPVRSMRRMRAHGVDALPNADLIFAC